MSDRFRRVEQVFAEAWSQPAGRRRDYVDRICAADLAVRDEVVSLLTAAESSTEFMASPALDVFARRMAGDGWSLRPGDRVGVYRVDRLLGSGGMGEVWRARDDRLGRDVAIKVLLPYYSNDADRVRRFEQEARSASALNQPNLLTVHDVGEHNGAPYLVTECLDGESLRARIAAHRLTVDEALDFGLQVAHGLAAAHARGIVHRDLKPENIFLVQDGRVKILDFGLAKLHGTTTVATDLHETRAHTRHGVVLGTPGYMAPEQVLGEDVDARCDVFAAGAVLYEMLAGRRAFQADGTSGTLQAILTIEPRSLSAVNPDVPAALSDIVSRCLAKAPDDRFASAADLASALDSLAHVRRLPPPPSAWTLLQRRRVLLSLLGVVLAMGIGGWRWWAVNERARWARTVAAPEIQRLVDRGDFYGAFEIALKARETLPDDPQLAQLWVNVTVPMSFRGEPEGADVRIRRYGDPAAEWYTVGRTPLDNVRIPRRALQLQISKAGFATIEIASSLPVSPYRLDPLDQVPPGMVRVFGGLSQLRFGLTRELDDFWIDRFEVTNRQFKQFVDLGGYQRHEYWRTPFVDGARTLSFNEAMARFRDSTGRPGPATWELGTYPEGQADFPVGGVSWYEAAAYAAFAGKSLPTMYHWYRAAGLADYADILRVSNINAKGPVAAGARTGLGPFGTYDMAGNVKEWSSTDTDGQRFILGGGWNEPAYTFEEYDARPPFDRQATYGFRLAKYSRPLPASLSGSVRIAELIRNDREPPVPDAVFEVFRRQFAYDRGPVNATVEATDDAEFWRKQTIALDAAYENERFRAFLYLPKNGLPPYQTVVYFPPSDSLRLRSSREMSLHLVDSIIRGGRAVLFPVYEGTYERGPAAQGDQALRELRIAWSRDIGRSLDYLETRTDIDRNRFAFFGASLGGDFGVIATALEPRFKASVLQGTGLWRSWPAEIDPVNFAPRVRVPTLMVNGRYDFENPVATSQRPLFELLGTHPEHKRHRPLDGANSPWRPQELVAELLAWFDRYLGSVGH
jgi:hypothetical protein